MGNKEHPEKRYMNRSQYLKVLFEKLSDFIKQGKEYNVSITSQKFEVKEMRETQPPKWAIELISDVKSMKSDIRELKQDMIEVKADIKAIKACPTIERELSNK